MIVQSGERASQLTGQLLAYSGKAQFFVERLDLSSVVRNSCDLIGPSIPNGIQLSLQTAGPALFIEADRNQIQQVITNLVMNAVEAIPENRPGKVVVRTFTTDLSTELLPEDHLGPNALAAGTYAVLEIQDTGSGMDAETKARIFDPFFSTKFVGRGLGLAAVQGIMRSAKGRIMVDSSPGKGSTFTVLLPIPGVPANSNRPSPSADMSDRNSAGTILVIGDEPVVRQMMSVVLKRAGYQVRTAEDGQAALSIFERQQNSISLVLLDMGMPQMGGADVLRRMRAYGYRVPVVICSGYSEAEVLTQFAGCDFSGFIQKPFRMDELIRRVSVLLRAVPAPQ
jgi:CheY-like chemotaxis protein